MTNPYLISREEQESLSRLEEINLARDGYRNASYDVKVLQKHMGWTPPWERIHDTMVMKYLMEPGKPAALKDSASRLISPVVAQGEKELEGYRENGPVVEPTEVYQND